MKFFLLMISVLSLVQCTSTGVFRGVASGNQVLDSSGYLYDPNDKSCDGYPKLAVQTMPGTCLGLVVPRARAKDPKAQKEFVKPRTIVQIPQTDQFLVADMGGWSPNNGRLFLLFRGTSGNYEVRLLKHPLDNPHGLSLGPDGFYYIGEKGVISRFRLQSGQIVDWQLVLRIPPRKDGYMHPLTQFTFDPRNGDLYVNSGSPSDHCYAEGHGAYRTCPETEAQGNGAIYRIPSQLLKSIPPTGIRNFEVAALGLRNSMAMVIHPAGFLIQGENSRDFPELEEPYEELNVIDLDNGRGLHYGWPYCYDFNATSPEWISRDFKLLVDCSQPHPKSVGEYQRPHTLIPPHAAPLHAAYYNGKMFGDLFNGKLIMSWHGYQPTGHRLVAYDVDPQGRPLIKAPDESATFGFDRKGGCAIRKKFEPRGGLPHYAPYQEIISQWNAIKGVRPKGAPVGFTVAEDGSIWIVEDLENRTIVRLARTNRANHQDACNNSSTPAADPLVTLLAYRHYVRNTPDLLDGYTKVQTELIQKNCLGCHGNFVYPDLAKDRFSNLDFLIQNDWIEPQSPEKSKIYGSIAHLEGAVPMPPIDKPQFYGTPEGQRLNQILAQWIGKIPTNIEKTISRWSLKDKRNIRQKPGTEASVCGQLRAGDLVDGDRRPEAMVTTGNIHWMKVYLVPSHSRLTRGACPWPEDGVYWIAD